MTFRSLLKEKDIRGAQLARRICVSRSLISHWVLGKAIPKENHITQIATVLNVSVEEVIKCFEEQPQESV